MVGITGKDAECQIKVEGVGGLYRLAEEEPQQSHSRVALMQGEVRGDIERPIRLRRLLGACRSGISLVPAYQISLAGKFSTLSAITLG